MTDWKREFVPTPQQFMAIMDAGLEFTIVPSYAHGLYYLYPKTETALFDAMMTGIPCLDRLGEIGLQVEATIEAMQQWKSGQNKKIFEEWRIEFNQRRPYPGSPTIPKVY